MIKLIRIDDRLVHGQVSLTWTPSLGVDCLLVANDKLVKDEFLKMTMGLAKPSGAKLLIKSVDDTILFLKDAKYNHLKILVLINSVADAFRLTTALEEIQSINFGGIRSREGSKLLSKAIALTQEDISMIRQLFNRQIELEVRQVPTDKKIMLQDLLEKIDD